MAEDNRNDKNDNIKVDNRNDADKTTKEGANAQAQKPKQQRRTKKTAVQSKSIVVTSKRKEAIARAYIKKGTGKITINKVNVDALKSKVQKAFIFEPIEISTAAANYAKNIDIKINHLYEVWNLARAFGPLNFFGSTLLGSSTRKDLS